ncbi:4512_t:CDS:2 [Dentiscutata heterogama]|uniref:4512_t:CDS:1 n=1 Tax=Dentiscutata heterogama TaxID=1316150 RepID=A0ACA9KDW2_9GLOM|nr:4512_t:CDS:2 [Dentiscutata heterogama]
MYLRNTEPNNNSDNDKENWYLCNNIISKDWLGLNNCEKVKSKVMEKSDKDKKQAQILVTEEV